MPIKSPKCSTAREAKDTKKPHKRGKEYRRKRTWSQKINKTKGRYSTLVINFKKN